jgi:hypothetical protein
MFMHNKYRYLSWIGLLLIILFVQSTVYAVLVDPLPDGNLVTNPWFRNGNRPDLLDWVEESPGGEYWSTSQKDSNPSPDNVVGTSARLANGAGQGGYGSGIGGVDAILSQVITANPAHRQLTFKAHWVTGWINSAIITIYGSDSPNGPWQAVWIPLFVNAENSSHMAWTQTDLLTTVIEQGFGYYKVELFGNYPENTAQGFKVTGVYFTTTQTDAPAQEMSINVPGQPSLDVTEGPRLRMTPTPRSRTTPTATAEIIPTAVPTTQNPAAITPPAEPTLSITESEPNEEIAAVGSPESAPTEANPANGAIQGEQGTGNLSILYGFIVILAGLTIFFGAGWWQQRRKNSG